MFARSLSAISVQIMKKRAVIGLLCEPITREININTTPTAGRRQKSKIQKIMSNLKLVLFAGPASVECPGPVVRMAAPDFRIIGPVRNPAVKLNCDPH
jgi:hypothetical protein